MKMTHKNSLQLINDASKLCTIVTPCAQIGVQRFWNEQSKNTHAEQPL